MKTVAATILTLLLIGAYFVAAPGDQGALPGEYLLNAALLGITFWFPAMRLAEPRDLGRQWKSIGAWVLAWTVVWDVVTSGLLRARSLFEEWWVVYPSSLLLFGALFLLHAAIARRFTGAAAAGRPDGSGEGASGEEVRRP